MRAQAIGVRKGQKIQNERPPKRTTNSTRNPVERVRGEEVICVASKTQGAGLGNPKEGIYTNPPASDGDGSAKAIFHKAGGVM
jgi:hypothetical protein